MGACIGPPGALDVDDNASPDAGPLPSLEAAQDLFDPGEDPRCFDAYRAQTASAQSNRQEDNDAESTTLCHVIGGSVSGLVGTGLVLTDGRDEIAVDGDGTFVFPSPVLVGGTYAIEVAAEPRDPAQHCTVFNHGGAVTDGPISDVRVVCSPCGDGRQSADPAGLLEFEWRVTAAAGTEVEVVFEIDGVAVASGSTTTTGDRCTESIQVVEITDSPTLAALERDEPIHFGARISSGAHLAWAVATVHRVTGQSEFAVFDPLGDGAKRSAGCAAFHAPQGGLVATSVALPMAETCDDGNLDSGDGCSSACRLETCVPGSDSDGDRLDDCVETNTGRYRGPDDTGTDPGAWDTDRDGIADGDEVLGSELGLDLPAMGASPLRRDLFVETDWIADDSDCGAHDHRPSNAVVGLLSSMYEQAPLRNPDGSYGISLHLDRGQGGPFTGGNEVGTDAYLYPSTEAGPFVIYKRDHFDERRVGYFHYVVLAHDMGAVGGVGELGGDDLAIGTGGCDVCFQCGGAPVEGNVVATTLAHELGHNLGLRHGGDTQCNYKPNYPSIMNYRDAYAGIDVDCDGISDRVMDYSRGSRLDLNESTLHEARGVCGSRAIDWNDSNGIEGEAISMNVNAYTAEETDCGQSHSVLRDHDDWARLRLNAISSASAGLLAAPQPCYSDPASRALRQPAAQDWPVVAGAAEYP